MGIMSLSSSSSDRLDDEAVSLSDDVRNEDNMDEVVEEAADHEAVDELDVDNNCDDDEHTELIDSVSETMSCFEFIFFFFLLFLFFWLCCC